ncbi:MAG: hypothetical protein PHQ74_00500 [Crocinitomicaceae bacterium]|nr:hypothetical protein [Crocinitomicaceae bacterium]
MKKVLFSFVFLVLSISSAFAVTSKSTVLLNNDIELTVEIIAVKTNCYNWGYHYGEIANFKSKSLTNSPYNITFNINVFSGLGNGYSSYGGNYNLSTGNPAIYNKVIFNNGKQVNYPNKNLCKDLTLADINLIDFSIDYWGSVGGNVKGNFNVGTLPIELLSFTATAAKNQVNLTWITASEKNNDYFTIERTVDGLTFEEVGKVAGQGNSSLKNEYTFSDTRPKNGISYYRLKQTDYNGESEYFEVKSVNIQKGDFVSNVYPNPAVMNRTTVFVEKTSSMVTLNVRNVLGQLISSKEVDATSNGVAEEIELTSSDKMFFVEIVQGNTIVARHKILNN